MKAEDEEGLPESPFDPPARITDLPFEDYLNIDAAQYSALKVLLARSPAHVKGMERKESESMSLGTIVHSLTLEPEKRDQIAVKPADLPSASSNAGKEAIVAWMSEKLGINQPEAEGSTAGKRLDSQLATLREQFAKAGILEITRQQYVTATAVRDAIMLHPQAGILLQDCESEVTMLARDPGTGVLCKIRCDALPNGHNLIVDLKTTQDASFEGFSRTVGRFQYHLQAALYRWVYKLVADETPGFLHIVAETEPPYGVIAYDMDQEAISAGEGRMRAALSRWAKCERTGVWPGYETGIVTLSLPRWAL